MAHLVRFDWAVKKLLRDKANFDVLEGFLTELFGFNVKIEQISESESNKQHKEDKFNRLDLLVRTDKKGTDAHRNSKRFANRLFSAYFIWCI